MHPTIQTHSQMITGSIFGSAFVHEHHSSEGYYFAPSEERGFVVDFAEILKALRAALSLSFVTIARQRYRFRYLRPVRRGRLGRDRLSSQRRAEQTSNVMRVVAPARKPL